MTGSPGAALRHVLSPASHTLDESRRLLAVARALKAAPLRTDLAGKSVGLVFFNPSLRTRSSMTVGAFQLGGQALTLDAGAGTWKLEHRDGVVMDGDAAEHVKEAARVLSRYVDLLAIRAFPERRSWAEDRTDPVIEAFARWSEIPVINLESSLYHPCQSLADLMTIEERLGTAAGKPIAITWAYHPKALPMAVPNSILLEAAKFGMDVRLAHPEGWELDAGVMAAARSLAAGAGGRVTVVHEMDTALEGAQVVYAKSWGSIQTYEDPAEETRRKALMRDAWRVTVDRMARTDRAFFMHCLPVRRGVVVDDAVLDGPDNAAYDQAENRLHAQKAIMLNLVHGSES